jgi:hypothetical protein
MWGAVDGCNAAGKHHWEACDISWQRLKGGGHLQALQLSWCDTPLPSSPYSPSLI